MPTTRKRVAITVTDELEEMLRHAAERWPEDKDADSRLLLHLIDEGARVVADDDARERAERLRRRRAVSAYLRVHPLPAPTMTLAELREDWPE